MFYLDEIRWNPSEEGMGPHYFRPESAWFDLRNMADQGVPNVTAGRFVLAEGPVVPVGAIALGEPGHVLTLGERAGLAGVVGEAVPAITVAEAVERLAVNWTDPTGQTRCKPVRVGRGMRLAFKIGSVQVNRRVQLADSEWLSTLAVERRDYAAWRQEARAAAQALANAGRTWEDVQRHLRDKTADPLDRNLARMGAPDRHLRCLDYLREKYVGGRTPDEVDAFLSAVRGGLPDEGLLPHGTLITESWNCADSASLACDQTHTEVQGNLDIIGNEAENTLSEAVCARMEADVSSTDHYAESSCAITVTTSRYVFVCARYSASAHTHYIGGHINSATATYTIGKVVIGVVTGLGNVNDIAPGSNYILDKMHCNGDTQKMYAGGVEKVSLTDTAITTGTRGGVHGNPNGGNRAHFDSLTIEDLAVSPGRPLVNAGLINRGLVSAGLVN